MKRTLEVKADPGKQLTFDQVERFVQQARAAGAGPLGTVVKATVRFNGTLRGLSIEVDTPDVDERPRGQSVQGSTVGGSVNQVRNVKGDVTLMDVDDAWLAQQW
jgi:hypothetical protein